MRVEEVAWADPRLRALCAAQQAELAARYGAPDVGHDWPGDDVVTAVLVSLDDEAVACGVLRAAGPGLGELKRMFVVPAARGRGLSRLVLTWLERAAQHHGLTRLVLETGVLQPDAIGLYLSAGYLPIDRYAPYEDEPASRCFAKDLVGDPAEPSGARSGGPEAVGTTGGLVVAHAAWRDPELVALRRQMALYLRGLYGPVGYFADDGTLARAEASAAGRVVLVVRAGDDPTILGTVTLAPHDPVRPAGWGRLERLYVLPAARGRGVARRLLAAVHDEARALGLDTLGLSTGTRQPAAVRLYTRCGYRPVAPPASALADGRLLWFARQVDGA